MVQPKGLPIGPFMGFLGNLEQGDYLIMSGGEPSKADKGLLPQSLLVEHLIVEHLIGNRPQKRQANGAGIIRIYLSRTDNIP